MATATPVRPELEEAESAAPYVDEWQRFASTLPSDEPAELVALRRAAIERFGVLGFPTIRQEQWRFTNVAPIARTSFARPRPATAPAAAATVALLAPLTFPVAARLVFVDGEFAADLSELGALPSGVVVESLRAALRRPASPLSPLAHLGRHARFDDQPFVALNTAFFTDGAFIALPPRTVLEQPLHVVHLASSAAASPTVSYPRNLLVLGDESQATIVETYAGSGAYWTCAVTELVTGASAVVDHYKVQRESREAFHTATFQLQAERSSAPSSHSISLGGLLVRNDVNAMLDGPGIDCILNGLYLADGRQHVDNHMRVEHAKPHCASHELYKGILDGKARSVFNGLIHVHRGAQKTDAKQSNRNLLLSADAIANSNPQLEIFADDVRCTHGSTVGQLDEDAVFYLRSRGIGAEAARSLLTYAFASELVERIRVPSVRRDLEEFLFARLPLGEVVRQAI
jgi:Fe-S cluster assembly protein SufD